jgi:hypothetical protein
MAGRAIIVTRVSRPAEFLRRTKARVRRAASGTGARGLPVTVPIRRLQRRLSWRPCGPFHSFYIARLGI